MKFFGTIWIFAITLFTTCSHDVKAEVFKLSVVTEEAISLQYISKETHKMEGPAAVLVEKVINSAGIDFTTKVLPWARAYKEAEQTKNTLIYSMVRTPARESKFHWLGVISKPQYYLFALKSAAFTKTSDVNSFKHHRVATLLDSASYHLLKNKGFENLIALNNGKTIFEMLKRKRVDFITANKRTFQKICAFNSSECAKITAVAPIKMPKNNLLYFAMNKESDPVLVNTLKATYQELLANGDISIF